MLNVTLKEWLINELLKLALIKELILADFVTNLFFLFFGRVLVFVSNFLFRLPRLRDSIMTCFLCHRADSHSKLKVYFRPLFDLRSTLRDIKRINVVEVRRLS